MVNCFKQFTLLLAFELLLSIEGTADSAVSSARTRAGSGVGLRGLGENGATILSKAGTGWLDIGDSADASKEGGGIDAREQMVSLDHSVSADVDDNEDASHKAISNDKSSNTTLSVKNMEDTKTTVLKKLPVRNSAFALGAWITSVHPLVRADVKVRFDKMIHEEQINEVITRLYDHDEDADIADILDTFWEEWKQFRDENGLYESRHMWNSKDAKDGNSAIWHEQYSLGRTKVLGYVAARFTSKGDGMGAAERVRGESKSIKTEQRSMLRRSTKY